MTDYPTNVFIFGAGCSVDAGIPLLGTFIDKMFDYCFWGRINKTPIPERILGILRQSNQIRLRFEKYQIRASFDTRNLEDTLSLLSFERLIKDTAAGNTYDSFVKSIAATIELSCRIKYRSEPSLDAKGLNEPYERFCKTLLTKYAAHPPVIITFNYDLVFERAIWDMCHFPGENVFSIPEYFSIDYGYPLKYCVFLEQHIGYKGYDKGMKPTLIDGECPFKIPYYKLHGSLNWPDPKSQFKPNALPTEVCDDPLILPPVFNKMATPDINNVWSKALDAICHAVNIIIVGYSLPKTDIYMQYFLKSAVGPNENLSRIVVFNPALFQAGHVGDEMKQRYAECFSQPFQNRIEYNPPTKLSKSIEISAQNRGTFQHFVWAFTEAPESILFMP